MNETDIQSDVITPDFIDFGVGRCLRVVKDIDEKIGLPDGIFVDAKDTNKFPAKSWFLRQALYHVEKVICALMLSKVNYNFAGELDKWIKYLDVELMRRDQIGLQIRKLREVLVRLILFKQTNDELFYHHYILIEEVRRKKNVVQYNESYFGVKNKHLMAQERELETALRTIERKLNYSDVWYEQKNKNGVGARRILLEKDLLDAALSEVSDGDKIALGYFYGTYMLESSKIHASFGVSANQHREGENEANNTFILSLVQRVLIGIAELLRMDSSVAVSDIQEHYRLLMSKQHSKERMMRQVKRGDVVAVFTHLGIVRDIKENPLGYRSFLVDFGSNEIVRGEKTDWYGSLAVQFVMKGERFDRLIWNRIKKKRTALNGKVTFNQVKQKSSSILENIRYAHSQDINVFRGDEVREFIENIFRGDDRVDILLWEIFRV